MKIKGRLNEGKMVKVRKTHECESPDCGGHIIKGEFAVVVKRPVKGRSYNYWQTFYFHPKCPVVLEGDLY